MSKKGIEYALSREKREFDLTVAGLLLPVNWGVRLTISRLMPEGVDPIFEQLRIGQNGEPFPIHKYTTRCPESGKPLGRWARLVRKLGPDELAQLQDIRDGHMSVVGWRPLIPTVEDGRPKDTSYEEFYDHLSPALQKRHDRIVLPTRPGNVSTYGIEDHFMKNPAGTDKYEKRAENNIQDVMDGSIRYDLHLLTRFLRLGVMRAAGVPMQLAPEVMPSEVVIPLQRHEGPEVTVALPSSMEAS